MKENAFKVRADGENYYRNKKSKTKRNIYFQSYSFVSNLKL